MPYAISCWGFGPFAFGFEGVEVRAPRQSFQNHVGLLAARRIVRAPCESMTKRPRLQTLKPRVATLSTTRSGIREASSTSWRTVGQSAASRGYDHRWRAARLQFLADNPFCPCGMLATVVDHVVAHHGDEALFWDMNNWAPMCASCHGRKTVREQREARGGGSTL